MYRASAGDLRQSTILSSGLHVVAAAIAIFASSVIERQPIEAVFDEVEVVDTQEFNALVAQAAANAAANAPDPAEGEPSAPAEPPASSPALPIIKPVTAVTPENLPAPIFDPRAQGVTTVAESPAPETLVEPAPVIEPAPVAPATETPPAAVTEPAPAPVEAAPQQPAAIGFAFTRPVGRNNDAILAREAQIAALASAAQTSNEAAPVPAVEAPSDPAPTVPEAPQAPAPTVPEATAETGEPAAVAAAPIGFALSAPAARDNAAIAASAERVAAAQLAAQSAAQAAPAPASTEPAQSTAVAEAAPVPTEPAAAESAPADAAPADPAPVAEAPATPSLNLPRPQSRPSNFVIPAPAPADDVVEELLSDVLAQAGAGGNAEISRIEQNAILQAIQSNWITSALREKDNFEQLIVTLAFVTAQTGEIVGEIALVDASSPTPDFLLAFETAKRAVLATVPFDMPANTPVDGLAWTLTFDPAAGAIRTF